MSIAIRSSLERTRVLFVVLIALTIGALAIAPSASAADFWSGVWNTKHKFGKPKLDVELIKKDGDDIIKGVYYDDQGNLLGNIRGVRDKDGGTEFWAGTFRDNGSSKKGKFSVVLLSDQVSFAGWFKVCGTFTCSERYKWTGEHA